MEKITSKNTQKVKVKVKGQQQEVEIDHNRNKLIQNQINGIINKNKCDDIFQEVAARMTQKGQSNLLPPICFGRNTRNKLKKRQLNQIAWCIKLCLGLKALQGKFYLMGALRKIEIAKELMVFDVEEG
jgi:hypothetical protein